MPTVRRPRDIAEQTVRDFFPRAALQIGEIRDLDRTLADAVQYKFIPAGMTQADFAGLFDILYRPPPR